MFLTPAEDEVAWARGADRADGQMAPQAGAGTEVQALLGHASLDTTARYFNPRELHQTGEKPQVA